MKIMSLDAVETVDSRGCPTLSVIAVTEKGSFTASVPAGASVGAHEAAEKRDGGKRLGGKGVKKACENVRGVLCDALKRRELKDLKEADGIIIACDPFRDKRTVGANAALGVSMALARAFAAERGVPLYRYFGDMTLMPCPMMNILNGGAHADNNLDIQEFMIMPAGAKSFRECMDMGMEVYFALKSLLGQRGLLCGVGDEGGFAPDLDNDAQALGLICSAVKKAGLEPGEDVYLALDAAASGWHTDGSYTMKKSGRNFSRQELISYYKSLCGDFPVVSIEDGLDEDDFEGARMLKDALRVQMVGDDLFVTDTERIKTGIEYGCASAVLIKPNQTGTVTQAAEAIRLASRAGMASVISHRSGDTEDSFIADMCVGLGVGQIKTGAPCRAERTAKYSRLLIIEHELGKKAIFAGKNCINNAKWLDS